MRHCGRSRPRPCAAQELQPGTHLLVRPDRRQRRRRPRQPEIKPRKTRTIGDFFGLGLGEYFVYESGPLSVGSQKALNAYFPMPFRKSAKTTVTNEGEEPIRAFYYNIDWQKHRSLPDDLAYFHAEYRQAVATDGCISRSPATLLFTPRAARTPPQRRMNLQEVNLCFEVLDQRERLIAMLALTAGMRPGEILALQWKHIRSDHIEVVQRVYHQEIDTPKTKHSVRSVALSPALQASLESWREVALSDDPEAWVFASERGRTPVIAENIWRRNFLPRLKIVGLEWATFLVMRRTHASLMRDLDVDPKLVADQLGHTLDVSLNVYAKSGLARRSEALALFESRLKDTQTSGAPN